MILELSILAFYATYGFWGRSLEYLRRSKEIYGKVTYNEEDCLLQKRIEEYCLINKYNGNDRISRLPDDILYSVISLLEERDAFKASVVSRRWRYICASLSDTNIEFDLCKMFGTSNDCSNVGARLGLPGSHNKYITKEWVILNARRHIKPHLCPSVEHKFAKTVDQFIKLYLGPQVSSFKVAFCFERKFTNAVNRWISFAIRMGVERLDLNFVCSSHIMAVKYPNMYDGLYTLSSQLLSEASNLKHLRVYSCMLKPDTCCRFNTLHTLDLNYVPLTQGDLENLLLVCLNLETLMVKQCNLPVRFCIFGPPSLQKVVVNCCRGLKEIELSAINLSTFELTDCGTIKISFSNVPKLEKVFLWLGSSDWIQYIFKKFAKDLPQLKTLLLKTEGVKHIPTNPIKLSNVMQLELFIYFDTGYDLVKIMARLLRALPRLRKLLVQIAESLHFEQKSVEEIAQRVHTHLKEVELGGFSGTWSQMECAIYLLRNAVALNQMVIDPWYYPELNLSCGPCRHRWSEGVRKNIHDQLQGNDYFNANVVVRYNQPTQRYACDE